MVLQPYPLSQRVDSFVVHQHWTVLYDSLLSTAMLLTVHIETTTRQWLCHTTQEKQQISPMHANQTRRWANKTRLNKLLVSLHAEYNNSYNKFTCSSISGLAAEIHSQHATALSNDCLVNSLDGDQHTLLSSFLSRSINKKTTSVLCSGSAHDKGVPHCPNFPTCIHVWAQQTRTVIEV